MASKYLDSTGLSYFWGKLKAYFQPKLVSGTNIKTINNESILGSGDISVSGGSAKTFYGVCETTGSAVAKTVTISDFTSSDLVTGVRVTVKFTYANSVANPTLNVSSTGAIAIKRNGSTAVGTFSYHSWLANEIIDFVYDGTYWLMANYSNKTPSTTTTANVVLRSSSSTTNPSWGKITKDYLSNASSIPTTNYIALFDSSAHMSSTDMTSQEVSDFVDALDGQGSSLADYVIEQGTSDIWTYRKWSSGIAECWGTYTHTASHYTTALGGYAYKSGDINFPSNLFTDIPIVTYSGRIGGGLVLTGTQTSTLTKDKTELYAVSTSSGSQTCYWYISAIGRWK